MQGEAGLVPRSCAYKEAVLSATIALNFIPLYVPLCLIHQLGHLGVLILFFSTLSGTMDTQFPSSFPSSFPILDDARPHDTTLPAFMVSTTRGFLPRQEPVVSLPAEFDPLESILSRMPITTASGAYCCDGIIG